MPVSYSIGPLELMLVFFSAVFLVAVFVWPLWKICSKAGLTPALSLLALFPFGIVIVLFVLAVSEWPTLNHANAHHA